MNCTEDSRVCKEQLIVVLLLLRAVEAALIRHKGLAVHRMSLPSKTLLLWVYISLQHRNRVISGFTIDKGWNEKTLYNKVKAQFPEECKDIEFEFVKNISGVLVKPTLASGVRINGNILLKSIASTGAVYVRLLVEDDPDEVDSGIQRSMDDFMSEVNQESIIVQDEVQSMNCEGPNTNRHKEEERAVEQGHAVESADDQERDSGEQHALITADDQEGGNGEQHVVQPAAHKEQPIDNGEPLSEG